MYKRQVQTLAQLEAQKKKAEQALELVQSRFQRGLVDYLRVLTTLQSLQRLEQSLVEAKRRQLSNRIGLCRALGGTWTKTLKAPKKLLGAASKTKTTKKNVSKD